MRWKILWQSNETFKTLLVEAFERLPHTPVLSVQNAAAVDEKRSNINHPQ